MVMELEYDKKQISSVFLGISLVLVFLLLIYLIEPVLGAFAFTIVFAYILHPVIEFIMPYVKLRSLAMIFAFFFILVPFFILSIVLTSAIINQLIELTELPAIQNILGVVGENFKGYLIPPPAEFNSGITTLTQFTQGFIKFIQVLGTFFLQLFLAIFFTIYVLYKEDTIIDFYMSIKNEKIRNYLSFVDHALKQIVYSMFLTAFITGGVAAVVYMLFNLPFPIVLGGITAIIALIPILGVSLVYVPISIYLMIRGDVSTGLLFLGVSIVFVSILPDVVVRPFIAGRKEKINFGALVLGFVTGALAFGAVGVIIGPLIIISIIGFLRIFLFEEEAKSLHGHEI